MVDFSDLIYGHSKKVPTVKGFKKYVNLDNAASTPPFKSVIKIITQEAEWYSSIHRGTGYKSQYCTKKYEEAREMVGAFVGADSNHDVVIFTKNTTDSINKIRHYLPAIPGEMVVYTKIEHHSNELPWLTNPHYCLGLKNGELDLEQLENFLKLKRGKIKLLAVSGASNVTGYLPPIHYLATLAHEAGAKILIDGAQLVPHRPVKIYPATDPRHLDFLVFSGHKLYAPFGVGVLVGPRNLFFNTPPSQVGGGTLRGIGPAGIIWSKPPEVEEAGSPNVLGALALAESCRILSELGWDNLMIHEKNLLEYSIKKLSQIPRLVLYNKKTDQRAGVISFNIEGIYHYQVAKYLSESCGIGVRNGCFCARGYVQGLLNLSTGEIKTIQTNLVNKEEQPVPGMVRISFGCYNQRAEIDLLTGSLKELIMK